MNWQRLSQFLHLQAFVFRIDAFLTDENTVWTLASCPAPQALIEMVFTQGLHFGLLLSV
jgi:hypothetical protein